jgi:4-nitrophenyl phosphatase
MTLQHIRAVISDMDGVLWEGNQPLPGIQTLFAFLRERQLPFALATNNSTNSPANYVLKLAKMGVPDIPETSIITSSIATALYLQTRYPAGTRLYMVGMAGLREQLEKAGFVLADHDVQAVVSGGDFEFTYDKAKRATLLIRAGADFIGTNPDVTFPTPEGLVPGAGSILAMLEAATEKKPLVIGKPEPAMFEAALRILQTLPEETLMIGDRLDTDIAGAHHAGLQTALVLTGITQRDELPNSPVQPDFVFDTLEDLLRAWQG